MTASDQRTPAPPPLDDHAPSRISRRDRRWWTALAVVVVASFAVLFWMGATINQEKPPIPATVVAEDGTKMFTGDDIIAGQQVWQSLGGQQIGSVWGHGAYVAPDWTADWLHREATHLLDSWAKDAGANSYDQLSPEQQGALKGRLKSVMRTNTYDAATQTVRLSPLRVESFEANRAYFSKLFADGHEAMAIAKGTLTDAENARKMSAFFWWTSWAASTNRPGEDVTYTQNWPHEPLIDNVPPPSNILWSILSFVILLAGVAGMVYWHSKHDAEDNLPPEDVPAKDPLLGYQSTPSQRATLKYFFVVGALFLLQIAMGVLGAHYGVEGGALYGVEIDKFLPYSVVRTWHTQLGIFWIATAWLATGLYVAPAVGGKEPKFQRLGVNVLFGALIVVVFGSLIGEWLSLMGKLGHGHSSNFWFGSQGYEYVDLGRFWQIGLAIGLFLWLFLMYRAAAPALKRARREGGLHPTGNAPLASGTHRALVAMLLISCLSIAAFYVPAFGIGHSTHLSIAEYWRWWVVHLWVEGFFEVFATVVIAFLFARLGLIRASSATTAVIAATTIFLLGGIIGTGHHLYFTGSPNGVLALGASFSALEVVPLALMGFEAFRNLRLLKVRDWVAGYKWAIYFFVSVAFWNMLGAGVFGFLINPPISLFYVQGLNLTPLHGHTALFGVYGMLGIGLMLFCVRSLMPGREWNDRWIAIGFWTLNGGLLMMALTSLLPLGLAQAWASLTEGLWYARSPEFLYTPVLTFIRWLRVPGDVVFAIGAAAIGVFMVGLLTGHSLKDGGRYVRAGSLTGQDSAEPPLEEASSR